MRMDIDVGSLISHQISQMGQPNSSRLGFPALVIALCIARGVIFDSLTFESLSHAINLAYIKKNCWNLDDPTIIFPGTRKSRARGPDSIVPFSSTPVDPASTSTPAPSTSAPPLPSALVQTGTSAPPSSDLVKCRCSEVIVPMLQSLHHGLRLVMQSIHDSAQHRPIISMEDFMA